jgi:hypothetical protein
MGIVDRVLVRSHTRLGLSWSLPSSFPKTEIGLMTHDEFLEFRNPGHKHHPSDSYDFGLMDLNRDHSLGTWDLGHGSERVTLEKLPEGYRCTDGEGRIFAVIHDGVAYYDRPNMKKLIPTSVRDHRDARTDLEIRSYKQVKYVSEVAGLVSPIAKKNDADYPVVLQHLLVQGEPLTLRAEKQPEKDRGVTLAILNSEGLQIAQASNEWGATLLAVVREYRGKGLGKIIGSYWYEYNPSFTSGGFTHAGEENALALWRDRVHEFLARGWYTALVHEGKLTAERVKEILKDSGEHHHQTKPVVDEPPKVHATGDVLVYMDDDRIAFVVYDRAFLEEQDEKFIHGYGFFRDEERIGSFLFKIDYDRPFANLVTRVALQMAKDNRETIYDGEGYHDMIETDGIPGLVREGDYITVTQNLLPLKAMAVKEKHLRKQVDKYGQIETMLLEMGESKWS